MKLDQQKYGDLKVAMKQFENFDFTRESSDQPWTPEMIKAAATIGLAFLVWKETWPKEALEVPVIKEALKKMEKVK